MDRSEIKALLVRSKAEPVNCTAGFGKDKQALILQHETKSPMALVKQLQQQAGDFLESPCHSIAAVDVDVDPTLFVLSVSKAPSGLAAKLRKKVFAGFPKLLIRLEDSTVAECVLDEDGAEEPDE
jgi:hypothetical protein